MSRAWIHWATGLWMITSDGINLICKATSVLLSDVELIIDPLGLRLQRERGRMKTHAWAAGELAELGELQELPRLWRRIDYHPMQGQEHFQLEGKPIAGAAWLFADLQPEDQLPIAQVSGPIFGPTRRERVQQYGGQGHAR